MAKIIAKRIGVVDAMQCQMDHILLLDVIDIFCRLVVELSFSYLSKFCRYCFLYTILVTLIQWKDTNVGTIGCRMLTPTDETNMCYHVSVEIFSSTYSRKIII